MVCAPVPGRHAAKVHLENLWIGGWSQKAVDFQPLGGGEGYITNCTLVNNTGSGIDIKEGRVVVDGLHWESNDNAVLVVGNAIATVRNSTASGGHTSRSSPARPTRSAETAMPRRGRTPVPIGAQSSTAGARWSGEAGTGRRASACRPRIQPRVTAVNRPTA